MKTTFSLRTISSNACLIFTIALLFIYNLSAAQINIRASQSALSPLSNSAIQIDAAKGYLVSEIKDKVYYVTDGIYQMMFIVTSEGVVAVDAPPFYWRKHSSCY